MCSVEGNINPPDSVECSLEERDVKNEIVCFMEGEV